MDFPTDGRVRVFLTGGWDPAVREGLAAEYRILDARGAVVPVRSLAEGTRLTLVPERVLVPRAAYRVQRLHAYAGRVHVDDEARMGAEGGPDLTLRWYTEATFRTGAGRERRDPEALVLREAQARSWAGSSCGDGVTVRLAWKETALAPTDTLAVELREGGVVWRSPLTDGASVGFGDHMCDRDPVYVPGSFDVRLVVETAAGKQIAPDTWKHVEAAVSPRAPRIRRWHPSATASFFLPPVAPSVPAARGPETCPDGLESRETTTSPVRATSQSRRSPVRIGDAWWVVTPMDDAGAAELLRLREGHDAASLSLGRADHVGIVPADPGVLAVSLITESREASAVQVRRLDDDVRSAWTTSLPGASWPVSPFGAVGDDRALVGWLETEERGRGDRALSWILLDLRTGERLTEPVRLPPAALSGDVTAAWDGTSFLVVWGGGNALHVTRVGASGHPLGTESVAPRVDAYALARSATGTWLAWTDRSSVMVARLGPDGRVMGLPWTAGGGGGRWSSARLEGMQVGSVGVAVAWSARDGGRIAVTDATGAVSEPLAIPVVAPVLVSEAKGFGVATLRGGDDPVERVEHLVCRSEPAPGAPARLAE